DIPTAFHTLYGTALLLYVTPLIPSTRSAFTSPADLRSMAQKKMRYPPTYYWLAALDVFAKGETIRKRKSESDLKDEKEKEDWRLPLGWGRTLVCIADEKASAELRERERSLLQSQSERPSNMASSQAPASRNAQLLRESAHHLLVLAVDQFTRGMLYMPRRSSLSDLLPFSRTRTLISIADAVLDVAAKLSVPDDRAYWGRWVNGIL
ncbi:hypothetical protein SCHPADRAFT_796824, partial [Schizopora paradoxa]